MTRAIAYYPGCSLHGTARELDTSFRASAAALGLDLQEIPGWVCCGNTAVHSRDRLLATALPVNELVKVEQDMRLDAVAVPCAACFNRFQHGAHAVADPRTADDVAAVVGRRYGGGVTVMNLVDVYHDAVGLETLRERVVRPFAGLRVACYYGCLLSRPPKVTLAEDPEYPTHMDEVVRALGCQPVDWNYRTDCCGASLALCEQRVAVELVGRIVRDARACGAEAIVAACPLCQVNLDSRQEGVAHDDPGWRPLPVVYLSQLVARAVGADPRTLGLRRHLVDAGAVLG